MVSITGVAGCFTFRAARFASPRLGLDLATRRFAVLATFRALVRLAEYPLRSLARLCTFDFFLRLAILAPRLVCVPKRIEFGSEDSRGSSATHSVCVINRSSRYSAAIRKWS